MNEPQFYPPSIPITPEQHRMLAEQGNAGLLEYYRPRMKPLSEELKAAAYEDNRAELAKLRTVYRNHGTSLSNFNIWAGEYASKELIAVEEYLEAAARDIENYLSPGDDDEAGDEGEEWKREE